MPSGFERYGWAPVCLVLALAAWRSRQPWCPAHLGVQKPKTRPSPRRGPRPSVL